MEERNRQVVSMIGGCMKQAHKEQLIQLEMDYAALCLQITQTYKTCGKSDADIAQFCGWSVHKVRRLGKNGPTDRTSYRDLMIFLWACGSKIVSTIEPFKEEVIRA